MTGHLSLKRWRATLIPLTLMISMACSTQSAQPAVNKTLVVEVNFALYDSIDPARGVSPLSPFVDKNVYDTLLIAKPSDLSKPYPSLATSFTESADGQTFTFTLRHGVVFASGNPMTSADVVWSLTRLSGLQSRGAVVMQGLTASATDPYTVVVTSDTPNPAVPIELTQHSASVLDSKLVQQHGGTEDTKDQADDYLNSASAGSGPYMIESVNRTSQIVFKANSRYWGAAPAYSTVILRNVPEATQRLDIQDGQAQLAVDVTPQDAASMNSAVVNIASGAALDQLQVAMNASPAVSALTSNQDFRNAVRYGLDYQGLVALAGKGAIQSTGFIPVGILGSLPPSQATQRNLTLAKADLAKVGVQNPTIDMGYFSDATLGGLLLAPMAAKIQSDLKEVGITVNLAPAPFSVLLPKEIARTQTMWIRTIPADYPDATDWIPDVPGPSGNLAKWQNWVQGSDPSLDALVSKATTATVPAERGPAYQALVTATNDQAYSIYAVELGRVLVSAKSVHATLNPFDNVDLALVT